MSDWLNETKRQRGLGATTVDPRQCESSKRASIAGRFCASRLYRNLTYHPLKPIFHCLADIVKILLKCNVHSVPRKAHCDSQCICSLCTDAFYFAPLPTPSPSQSVPNSRLLFLVFHLPPHYLLLGDLQLLRCVSSQLILRQPYRRPIKILGATIRHLSVQEDTTLQFREHDVPSTPARRS